MNYVVVEEKITFMCPSQGLADQSQADKERRYSAYEKV